MIRDARDDDVEAVTIIRNELVAKDTSEWRDEPYTVHDRRMWLSHQVTSGRPVLVAVEGDDVVGVASYGDFRDSQRGYRFTVEHSIHVRGDRLRRGHGRDLVEELMRRAVLDGKHVMVAGIDGANDGSVHFHASLGFEVVARMPELGHKFGRWLELVLMQRYLDQPGAAR